MIVCDNKSRFQAQPYPGKQDLAVREIQTSVTDPSATKDQSVVWVQEHCNISGDKLAGELNSQCRRVTWNRPKGSSPTYHPASMAENVYSQVKCREADMLKTDKTNFCSGQHTALRRWQGLTGKAVTHTCRPCREEKESMNHLLLQYPTLILK